MLICNSVFPNDPARLRPLEGPRADGMTLWAALTDPATGLFPAEEVVVLHERSFGEILAETEEFFASAKPGDTLFFYYSGHGLQVFRELYLCGRDAVADRLASSAITSHALKKMMERSHASTIVVVLDCCYSGAFAKGVVPVDPQQLAGSGRYVITASSSTQTAADTDYKGHPSPFTATLVAALRGAADDADHDGYIDLDDLYRYVKQARLPGVPEPGRKFDGAGAVTIARRYAPAAEEHGAPADESAPDSEVPDKRAGAPANGPLAPHPVSLSSWFGTLHLRQRGDYSYGDLRSWMVNALAALTLVALSTLGQGALEEAADIGQYQYLASVPDVDAFCVACLIAGCVMLTVSTVEAVAARRVLAKVRSRRDTIEGLQAGPLYRVLLVRDGLALVAGVYLVVQLLGDELAVGQYSVMLAVLAVFPLVTLGRWVSRGDGVYLAGGFLAFAALLVPRSDLGYGASNAFGVLAVIHLLLVLSMLFGWLVRRRPRSLAILALAPVAPFLIAILVDGFLPLVAMVGCALALIGCCIGDGVPLQRGGIPAPPDYWPNQLRKRLSHGRGHQTDRAPVATMERHMGR
ncbi:caspase family protein [Streptomyces sp. NPDC007162]|uniref:caspase, EACC1-associated type n=1 Tax=Streptomyces sp. NPDC007162 TaxID=3156917 RepID=UPI0033C21407